MAKQVTFSVSEKVGEFFDGSTRERTLTSERVGEILASYVKQRSREDGKREDLAIVRQLMRSEEMKEQIRKMRESLSK
jgi:hypothetical protein